MKLSITTSDARSIVVLLLFVALLAVPFRVAAADRMKPITAASLPHSFALQYAEVAGSESILNPDALNWRPESKQINSRYSGKKRSFLIKSDFVIDPAMDDSLLYLCISHSFYQCDIYVNGHLLVQRGSTGSFANDYLLVTDYYIIPSLVLNRAGKKNTITGVLTSHRNNTGPFPEIKLMTLPQAEHYTLINNMINRDVPMILFAVGIINACFFLLTFLVQKRRRKDLRRLFFAAISLLYGLSCVDYAFSCNIADSNLLQKISVVSLNFGLLASSLFVLAYYRIWIRNKKVMSGIYAFLMVYGFAYLVFAFVCPAWKVANVFNESIIYLAIPILAMNLIVCVYNLFRKPKFNNVMMSAAYAFAFVGTCIDSFGLFSERDMLFTPFSMLFMIFTLLYLFSVEYSKTLDRRFDKEDDLTRQNEVMEGVVHQRTHELQVNNDKLEETIAELKEANALKDRFFSLMAHDIKNPLNAMIGFAGVLQDNYKMMSDTDRLECIGQIHRSSNGLYKLLENLLEWSRVRTGNLQCQPTMCPVSELMAIVEPLVEGTASAKGISLKYTYPQDASVYADKNMLVIIIRNLLGNAIKFSYPGGEIELNVDTAAEEYNEFTVTDHGIGMSPCMADKLFGMNTMVSTPGTNKEIGTGLGLLLCKEFVDAQGGTISVHSVEEKGTCISFRLPRGGG